MSRGRPEITLTYEQVKDALQKHKFYKDAANSLNVSYPTFLKEKERHGLGSLMTPETPRDSKLELIDFENLGEFIEASKETDKHCKKTIGYDEVSIKIDQRCIIFPWGDWHIGNEHTDHTQLAKDVELIREHSNIYPVLMGDYCDNFQRYSPGSGMYEQVLPVQEQKQRVEFIVRTLSDRILGIILGCHDKWMFDNDSFDFAQYLANKTTGYWMGFNGIFNLKVGNAKYSIYATHKDLKWSSDNIIHGIKSNFKTKRTFDIGFSAHRHIPGIEYAWIRNQWVIGMRCSSYKVTDYYIDHKNLPRAPYSLPCVLLDDKEKNAIAFTDLRKAIEYL